MLVALRAPTAESWVPAKSSLPHVAYLVMGQLPPEEAHGAQAGGQQRRPVHCAGCKLCSRWSPDCKQHDTVASAAITASTALGMLSAVYFRQKLAKLRRNRAALPLHIRSVTMQALGDDIEGSDEPEFEENDDLQELSGGDVEGSDGSGFEESDDWQELSAAEEPLVDEEGAEELMTTRSSLVIQLRLSTDKQYQKVLQLVERYLPKFDIKNMVYAMRLCSIAVHQNRQTKRQIQTDTAFISLFGALKKQVLSRSVDMPPWMLTGMLASCATLSVFDMQLFNEVVVDATRRMTMYSDSDIAYVVYALALLRQKPSAAFMQALVREMRARLDRSTDAVHLCKIVSGMSRLGIRDDRLMKSMTEHLLGAEETLDSCDEETLVRLCRSFSSLSYLDRRMFDALGHRIVASMEALSTKQLSNAFHAYTCPHVVRTLPDSHFVAESLLEGIHLRQHDFSNEELVDVAMSAARFQSATEASVGDEEGLRATENSIKRRTFTTRYEASTAAQIIAEQMELRSLQSFSMQQLVALLTSLELFRLCEWDMLTDLASILAKNAAELRKDEICRALTACAHLDFVHVSLVNALLGEVKRRGLLQEMNTVDLARLAYSLACFRILDEETMGQIAAKTCGQRRMFVPQSLTMVMWSMATLGVTENTEALANACMEDICSRSEQYLPLQIATCCWSFAILASGGCALRAVGVLLMDGFWDQRFNEIMFAMVHHLCISMRADHGIATHELVGWQSGFSWYSVYTRQTSRQSGRLRRLLHTYGIPHLADCIVPRLEGFPDVSIKADIVIEQLRLVIEVQGLRRKWTVPLDETVREVPVMDLHNVWGRPEMVIHKLRKTIECKMTGPCAFKDRLLRKGGWRIVTISSDENEEYIASALSKMMDGKDDASSISSDETVQQQEQQEQAQEQLETEYEEQAQEGDREFDPEDTDADGVIGLFDEKEMSPYERKLRKEYARAMERLQQRILEESGNAAAYGRYSDNLEFRRWQMDVEKEVFQEMLAALKEEEEEGDA